VNEALIQIKQELGEDAVILKTRKIAKGGVLNFLSREMIEVTASTPDHHPLQQKQTTFDNQMRETLARASKTRLRPESSQTDGAPSPTRSQGDGRSGALRESSHLRTPDSHPESTQVNENLKQLNLEQLDRMQEEITELHETVSELASQIKFQAMTNLPESLHGWWRDLVESGVGERTAMELTQQICTELDVAELTDHPLVESKLLEIITRRLKVGQVFEPPVSIAVIGPTGVGKTTTLAKLATNRKIFGGYKVALISTDTYRIAAVEQLKTFASIAGLPLEVVYRPEDLPRIFEIFHDKDVILIDTAGRSQNDLEALDELRAFMDAGKPDEVLLAVSAGTRLEDQREIIHRFGAVPATSIVITKLDEVAAAGHLLDLSRMIPREWIFLTTGQNVPDDIIPAEPLMLAEMILNRKNFERIQREHFIPLD